MSECDRLAYKPCGCRYDKPTGLEVHFCEAHDPGGHKNIINNFVGQIHRNAGIPSPMATFCKPRRKKESRP